MTITLGFDSPAEQGPGIFLHRLKETLMAQERFSTHEPDVWVQLSFQALPPEIEARVQAGQTKVLVRMNGCYCTRYHVLNKPWTLPLPIVDDFHTRKINQRKNARIRKNLYNAHGVVYQSVFSRRLTQRFIGKAPAGRVIYNGVPLNVFSPEGPVMPELAGRLNILVSHGFRPYHRLHDAMRILALAKDKLYNVRPHLHILGRDDGTSFAHAQDIADRIGLSPTEDYTFWGKLPFNELATLYRSCDLMLNLSYWDSCPNVVIEAMACGLPVVGVNSGGVAELVGSAGVLVNENIPFTYLNHLDFARMPKAPVAHYVVGLETVLLHRDIYRDLALNRVREQFDIQKIGAQYLEAAESLSGFSGSVKTPDPVAAY